MAAWLPVSPITAVGGIEYIEQERQRNVGDWRVNLSVDGCAFVEFSRRRFERATLDTAMDEIHVRTENRAVFHLLSVAS